VGEIRLGKIHLRWCDSCNVPIMEQSSCCICKSRTREVKITPPGDARPAFAKDIERIRSLVDRQFGEGTGLRLVPPERIVLLNKAPDIDRMDEVILNGEVVGAVRFSLARGERFLLRPEGAAAIAGIASKSWVRIDDGAAEAVRTKKASTLAIGVEDCAKDVEKGSEVLVLDSARKPVSVGLAKTSKDEMMKHERGTAVKTRWIVEANQSTRQQSAASWNQVTIANKEVITRRVRESVSFIKDIVGRSGLPVAVSYSGGKDSLATLLLVLDAEIRPKLLFVDTGLEFEETVQNVRDTAKRYSLELVVESAGESFWSNLSYFGPPAKDYRWCCKTCKLGPATRLIQRHFPEGVLSFIGQRAYESEQRAKKGRTWRNPWTPNQLAASPIQKWTAMHVWLYLMSKGVKANPLYEEGFERIGCFMCPATDLAELRLARKLGKQYGRWQEFLESYAKESGKGESWLEYDLWRWKRIPKSVTDELAQTGCESPIDVGVTSRTDNIEFRSTSGYSPCVEGLSMEGIFSKPLDMARVTNMLSIIGSVARSPDNRIAEVRGITVFAEGPVMVKAKDEEQLKEKSSKLKEVVFRAMNCAGCGICVARCKLGALSLDGRVTLDEAKCNHCGTCLGPCPVVRFVDEELDI
jgi:phosphoadenosine phosphosulfate reductase